ncbi:ferredoxin [Synergistales bacterium]|nr:ferredoxin [Synergistales bacterium]
MLTALCILGGGKSAAIVASIQPGPMFVRLSTEFSMSGLILLTALLGATFLFGRYFCSVLCPLGALQDVIGIIFKKNHSSIPNAKIARYGIAVASFLFLAGGWAIFFRLLDPFSRFAGILTGETWLLVALIALVFWKKRLYCAAVCPVGAILGLCAKHGVYQLRINETCVGCGLCETNCPTGCIDSQKRTLDNERCVRCLNCLSLCPRGSVTFSGVVADDSRRAFLIKGCAAVFGAAASGYALARPVRALARLGNNTEGMVFPPGASDRESFVKKCTSCRLCAISCPVDIIKPSALLGPVRLNYANSGCRYDCAACNAVCPSGALRHLTLENKQWLKIGEAVFDSPLCRVIKENKPCDLCAKACPKEAIFMADGANGLKIPEVNAFHCIGCGACYAICPMSPKAINVKGIEQQMMF